MGSSEDEVPHGTACQVIATWSKDVLTAPDPTHNGAMIHGLAGRVYLFGPEVSTPLTAEGSLVVDLYVQTPGATEEHPPVEEWRIDKDTLRRLLRRDVVGWGYSVFLPWGTYRPDVTQVLLKVRFEPPQGLPLYAQSAPLTLGSEGLRAPMVAPTPAPVPPGPAASTSLKPRG
jgi:hypothetical protein